VFVILSHKYGAEVDTLFVIALLTIIGISISDKIVVFDRIRENLKVSKGSFEEIVGMSLKQTFTRSINTSVTVILALVALYSFGPITTKYFTLTLIIGMIVGTYSSIFVASPLLTVWNKGK
jgi:preprotein translocase subunit SecF